MNIQKILFHKYFLIFIPVFVLNIFLFLFYFIADNNYSISWNGTDYHTLMNLIFVIVIYNFLLNPIYQLIINIIYNLKEWNKNILENFVLMLFSTILGMAIIFMISKIEDIKNEYYPTSYSGKSSVFFYFLVLIVLLIIIILGFIEKFILEKIFDKTFNKINEK
jgi:hypothetical protein